MNQNPAWKYLLLAFIIILGAVYALPNLFGTDPSIQITRESGQVDAPLLDKAEAALKAADIPYKSGQLGGNDILIRMPDPEAQLKAADILKRKLPNDVTVALNLAPRTPSWLLAIGAQPMALGLDLRGGVYFLLKVDMQAAKKQALQRYVSDLPRYLRDQNIRYAGARGQSQSVVVLFRDAHSRDKAQQAIQSEFPELQLGTTDLNGNPAISATLSEKELRRISEFALKQNLTTIRNRVNELGVAEPLVQRQGRDHIVVQLPGVQDSARAKDILGATATLEFHLVDQQHDPRVAAKSGNIPTGSDLYYTRDGRPVLLQSDIIATGNELVDASSSIDQQSGQPAVFVTLSGKAADRMFHTTERHLGDRMAVLYIENKVDTVYVDGKAKRTHHRIEQVISDATIQGVFGKRFQITGLSRQEAHNLALLLRAGALAAPVEIVQERTVGPSLGRDNIAQGQLAVVVGFVLVVLFMAFYYRAFGLIANLALMLNLVLVVAVMSLIQATLTLPGIAGIVLTLGMAVDANVLINERIREELRNGDSVQTSIRLGYDKAFITIADSNLTTLIAALLLFSFGTGPIKGFAVTLSIGIITSMFTAIFGTRVVVNFLFGGRRLRRLSI